MMDFFEGGQREGYINKDVSAETFLLYLNLLNEARTKIDLSMDKEKNQRLLKELTSLLFYGLVGPNGRPDRFETDRG
ncbi:hypothetical protein HMSSN139_39800 [Paenibacillus sp. HMSSN-139]|nr:hypothetical protein HMSSN139_39800 [Paenibacillus sp. HMSSN-139]